MNKIDSQARTKGQILMPGKKLYQLLAEQIWNPERSFEDAS